MTKRLSIASAVLTVLSALLALLLVASPAFADEDSRGRSKGKDKVQEQSDDAREREERDNDGDADNEEGQTTEANDGDADDSTDPNVDEDDNAHPSGKDRSVENGGSGNQGNSESDPDDDGRGPDRSNGGSDKPGGSGGVDAADQDGNNGCGNDDDFEDDNEGWCGKPQPEEVVAAVAADVVEATCPTEMTSPSHTCDVPEIPADTVLGDLIKNDDEVLGGTLSAEPGDDVAPAAATRPSTRGAALPFTGASIVLILVAALGLLGIGAALLKARRS